MQWKYSSRRLICRDLGSVKKRLSNYRGRGIRGLNLAVTQGRREGGSCSPKRSFSSLVLGNFERPPSENPYKNPGHLLRSHRTLVRTLVRQMLLIALVCT